MKIIEKIEIKYFRSFGVKTEIINLKNLNIFSGGNDSGKSNILRALDLFFNYNKPDFIFNINEDFSEEEKYRQKDFKKKTTIIEITIHFFSSTKNIGNANRSDHFSVRRLFDSNGYKGQKYILRNERGNSFFQKIKLELTDKAELKKYAKMIGDSVLEIEASNPDFVGMGETQISKTKKSVTNTVNRIEYYYIPAIRTRDFFQKMIKRFVSRIQEGLDNNGRHDLSEKMAEVEKSLENYSKIFFEHVPFLGPGPKFKIPNDLGAFFSQFDIGTGDNNTISFKNRGDGIQAHLVPEFLHFLSSDVNKGELSRPVGKYFIWAFEEPENSCEYSKAQEIADLFVKYSNDQEHNQVFITSHAFNFLGLSGEDICLYRVFKDGKNSAVFGPIPDDNEEKNKQLSLFKPKNIEKEKLEQELGIPDLMKKMFKNLEKELEEMETLRKEKVELLNKISTDHKPFLIVEDEYDQIYKVAWLKLNNIAFNENSLNLFDTHNNKFTIVRSKGVHELNKIMDLDSIDIWQDKKVVGLFDFDSGYNQFNSLKTSPTFNKRWQEIKGSEAKGLYKKRHDSNIYALLLPIPKCRSIYASKEMGANSKMPIELYFADDVLIKLGYLGEEPLSGVNEKRKIFIGDKSKFWKKLLSLPKKDFYNFKLLFDIVNKLVE